MSLAGGGLENPDAAHSPLPPPRPGPVPHSPACFPREGLPPGWAAHFRPLRPPFLPNRIPPVPETNRPSPEATSNRPSRGRSPRIGPATRGLTNSAIATSAKAVRSPAPPLRSVVRAPVVALAAGLVVGLIVGLGLLTLCATTAAAEPPAAGSPLLFQEVRAIVQTRCLKCHGPLEPKGELQLGTPLGLARGGESGPAVVPGNLAESPLWQRVAAGEMPPDAPPPRPSSNGCETGSPRGPRGCLPVPRPRWWGPITGPFNPCCGPPFR